jgi:hypothetical protein
MKHVSILLLPCLPLLAQDGDAPRGAATAEVKRPRHFPHRKHARYFAAERP